VVSFRALISSFSVARTDPDPAMQKIDLHALSS
jgi:hypothetical protein